MLLRGYFEDTSTLKHTDSEIKASLSQAKSNQVTDKKVESLLVNESVSDEPQKEQRPRSAQKSFKYKAKQVIERKGEDFKSDKIIPMGTNLIGRLLTSIDTRESEQFYKVFLPYGGKFKGGGEIPKGSTLFGKIKYNGKGDKVFISFSKGIFPNGKGFLIQAQALNPKDYSPGIHGDFHGQTGSRIAATLGLSMVSAGADVLTEKQELGQAGTVAAKANLKNAMYAGVSRAAEIEASRQAEKLNEKQEYVTVDAGKDLIINLTGEYKE